MIFQKAPPAIMNIVLRLFLLVCLVFAGQSYATTAMSYGYVANAVQTGVENLNNNGLTNPSGCCSKSSARDSQDRARARSFFALAADFYVPNSAAGNAAHSVANAARLNKQLAAEQAAGVRMPTSISGYTKHGVNQAVSRDGVGVSPKAILDTWKNPTNIEYVPTKYGPTFRLTGRDSVVVVNPKGEVVTTWATSSRGVR